MRFRLKITACMIMLLSLVFGISGSLLISVSFQSTLEREKAAALSTYQLTMETLQLVTSVSTEKDFSDISATLRHLTVRTGWNTLRLSQQDNLIYQYGNNWQDKIHAGADVGTCATGIFFLGEEKYLQVSGSFSANEENLELDMVVDVTQAYVVRDHQIAVFRIIFLVMLFVGAAAAWFLSYLLTKPLSKLSAAAKALSRGKLSTRVRVTSADEVGQLAGNFNSMACELEANIPELQASMQRQEQFMGSFAHELKTPLTSIIGYADLLRGQSLAEDEAMDAANYIFSEGKRLESLSMKLLDLLVLKNQTVHFVPTEPSQMISNLVRHLHPVYAQKGITLQCRCAPGSILLEPDLVKSLLVNLLDNARKAMESGGNIYVVSDWVDKACRIRVLDNGRGMPQEAISHITEAFYRVDKSRSRAQGGVGLGLTLCNTIAALHNGSISFESRIGNGTCVTVILKGGAP